MTIHHLASIGQSRRQIARTLAVDESTVRYHLERIAAGAGDGRASQPFAAAPFAEAITHYLCSLGDGPVNVTALHQWLVDEHAYCGSLRSVQRFYRAHYPKPRLRARRRVETPPGAQAQADWSEWPRLWVARRPVYGYLFHMRLSFSRYPARVWSPCKDQLAWHHVHNEAFRRLDGVPATVRVDNERTAVGHGAGSWGELNASYRRYARMVRFHIDACQPRQPQAKGKVERGNRDDRTWREVTTRQWASWDELQAWTDERTLQESARRTCPATGTCVSEAWAQEKPRLQQVPLLPEPFDVVVTRIVAPDCTVAIDGRRYSVPFSLLGQRVEVRGCARVVQVCADGELVAQHPRHGRERIVIDPRHYEGPPTATILPPTPLGRMGRKLQEIAALTPQQRPLDLYAALAEVAR